MTSPNQTPNNELEELRGQIRDWWDDFNSDKLPSRPEEKLLSLIHQYTQRREVLARIDESKLFMEYMQFTAETIPPSLLLNEVVNRHYDRLAQLQKDRREV